MKQPASLTKPEPIPIPSAPEPYPHCAAEISAPPASDQNKDLPPKPTGEDAKPTLPEAKPAAEEELMPPKPPRDESKQATGGVEGVNGGTPAVPGSPAETPQHICGQESAGKGNEEKRAGEAAAGVGMVGVAAVAAASSKGSQTLVFVILRSNEAEHMMPEDEQKQHRAAERSDQQKFPSHETSRELKRQPATSDSGILKAAGQDKQVRDKTDVPARGEESEAVGNREDEVCEWKEPPRSEPEETRSAEEEGKKHTHTLPTGKGGYGGDYHPAQLHPPPAGASAVEYKDGGASAAATSPQAEQEPTTNANDTPAASKSSTSGSIGKKVGFMAKVKGEAKIIAGRMSGKEEKVEEGKRMMHGDARH